MYAENCDKSVLKRILKQQHQLFAGNVEVVEWQGETPAVSGHNFDWTHHVVCDMKEVAFVRIELKGSNDSYVALAETKEHLAKKITYVFGGWNNTRSLPSWINKGERGQFHGN